MKHTLALALLALLLPACDLLAPPPEPSPTPAPTQTPETLIPQIPTLNLTQPPGVNDPTAAAVPNDAAVPRAVNISASDGLALRGKFYPAAVPAPGVLLLHMLGHSKEDWNAVGSALQEAGFAALAVDMRGHGDTGGGADWVLARSDVGMMFEWLAGQPNVDGTRLAAVGASIGANLALIGCTEYAACRAVALLSPGLDYRGVKTEPAVVGLGERPLLLVASESDTYSMQTVRALAEAAQGEPQLQIYQDAGHGTDMLNAEPDLQPLLTNWLTRWLME